MAMNAGEAIVIDGSYGEGGGQIVRTALSLSMATGRPCRLIKVRANRSKPGLGHQHLTAVRASAKISAAHVGGAELGAKEGYITVCAPTHPKGKPQRVTEGLTAGKRITGILDALEAGGYPIDRSRVYLTGQSMGGMTCAWAALEIPDVIAAIAPHGAAFAFNTDPGADDSQDAFTLVTPESDYAKAMEYDVPIYLEVGDSDAGGLPLRTEGVINGLNLWLQMNDCPAQVTLADSLAAQASTTDAAVKLVGVVGDDTWTRDIDGVVYHGVDFFRSDGVKMVELVGVENCPHWVTAAYPELAWEFLSRFSKDADGNLIVAE